MLPICQLTGHDGNNTHVHTYVNKHQPRLALAHILHIQLVTSGLNWNCSNPGPSFPPQFHVRCPPCHHTHTHMPTHARIHAYMRAHTRTRSHTHPSAPHCSLGLHTFSSPFTSLTPCFPSIVSPHLRPPLHFLWEASPDPEERLCVPCRLQNDTVMA